MMVSYIETVWRIQFKSLRLRGKILRNKRLLAAIFNIIAFEVLLVVSAYHLSFKYSIKSPYLLLILGLCGLFVLLLLIISNFIKLKGLNLIKSILTIIAGLLYVGFSIYMMVDDPVEGAIVASGTYALVFFGVPVIVTIIVSIFMLLSQEEMPVLTPAAEAAIKQTKKVVSSLPGFKEKIKTDEQAILSVVYFVFIYYLLFGISSQFSRKQIKQFYKKTQLKEENLIFNITPLQKLLMEKLSLVERTAFFAYIKLLPSKLNIDMPLSMKPKIEEVTKPVKIEVTMTDDVKAFEDAMKSADWEVRKKAIAKFSDLTEFSVSRGHLEFNVTLPKLYSKYKTESNDENRFEIIRALGRTVYNYPIDLDQKNLLPRPGQTNQTYKKIMPEYKEAALKCLPILLEALNDSYTQIRKLAILSLGSLGPLAKDALPKLKEYWKSTNDQEALEAINNISKGNVDDIYSNALEIIRQKRTESYSQALDILMKLDKEKISEIETELELFIVEDLNKRNSNLAFGLAKVLVKIENENAVNYLVNFLLDLPREWIWYPNLVLIYPSSVKLLIRLFEEAEKTTDKVKIANLDEVIDQMDVEKMPPDDFLAVTKTLLEKNIDMNKIMKKFEKNPIRQVAHRFHKYREPFDL